MTKITDFDVADRIMILKACPPPSTPTASFPPQAKTLKRTENGWAKDKTEEFPEFFHAREGVVADFHYLASLIRNVSKDPNKSLIRGGLKSDDTEARYVRRRVHDKGAEPAKFKEVPRRLINLDVDNVPIPSDMDPSNLHAVCKHIIETVLPREFHHVSHVAIATASHGLEPGKASVRLFFLADKPVTYYSLKIWLGEHGIDVSVFRTVQVNYTAAPIIKDGVPDFIPERVLAVDTGVYRVLVPSGLEAREDAVFQGTNAYRDRPYVARRQTLTGGITLRGREGALTAFYERFRDPYQAYASWAAVAFVVDDHIAKFEAELVFLKDYAETFDAPIGRLIGHAAHFIGADAEGALDELAAGIEHGMSRAGRPRHDISRRIRELPDRLGRAKEGDRLKRKYGPPMQSAAVRDFVEKGPPTTASDTVSADAASRDIAAFLSDTPEAEGPR